MQKSKLTPMTGLLSKEHTILERPYMEFSPFGVNECGERIEEISGVIVAANLSFLQDCLAKRSGPEAAARIPQELCRLLNERIRDPAYHVTPDFLRNEWNSYSYEFVCYVREFGRLLSGDPLFVYHTALQQHIAPVIQVLCRPFSMRQIYRLTPHLGAKYSKGIQTEIVSVNEGSAVIRMRYTEHAYRQFGPYRKACAAHGCQSARGGLVMLPNRVHGLPPATAIDRACIINGDEFCEWELRWVGQPDRRLLLPLWEMTAGIGVFSYLRHFHLDISIWEAGVLALSIPLLSRLAGLNLRRQSAKREKLIQEQVQVVEARHEELREVYVQQEQTQVELRRKIHELTLLHRQIEELNVGLEAKVQQRTAELERVNKVLQQANAQLQEMDRLKNEFFANISHEFRTPLTLTVGTFKSLLKHPSSERSQELIETGLRNTSRLLFLINEFLDLAKFDSGLMEMRKQCIDLAALVRAVAANFESAEHRRIEFRGVAGPVPIEADLGQMKKVLYNLLSNAFKFSDPDNGRVWIRLETRSDRVILEVEDNGIGIPQDQLQRIFDRFVQVERPSAQCFEGTGIGLALVKEVVSMHGGSITVSSELDSGTRFVLSLPRGSARADMLLANTDDGILLPFPEANPTQNLASTSANEDEARPLLLIVDDNADMRAYLAQLLGTTYRVISAKNGDDGLEQARTLRPELILTDLTMPRMGGHELLKAVRQDSALHATPVIVLTARTGSDTRIQILEAGADDYISKPFDEYEILARIGNLIRMRAQERQLAELQKEKLAQFLPKPLAELILAGQADQIFKSHRAEVTVTFIDLRGYTQFTETAEPEDIIAVLQEYQQAVGQIVVRYQGVIERYSGDAMMVFFNDPVPVPNHAEQAVIMAIEVRNQMHLLRKAWLQRGIELGAGIGIATGYATLGLVGCDRRKDYAAIGAVTNTAARLCEEAAHGQIYITERIRNIVKDRILVESVGTLTLKGFHNRVAAYNVVRLRTEDQATELSTDASKVIALNAERNV